jgi:hypothetical protein
MTIYQLIRCRQLEKMKIGGCVILQYYSALLLDVLKITLISAYSERYGQGSFVHVLKNKRQITALV